MQQVYASKVENGIVYEKILNEHCHFALCHTVTHSGFSVIFKITVFFKKYISMGHQLFFISSGMAGIETFFLQTKPWDENFFIPRKTVCTGTIPVINIDRSLMFHAREVSLLYEGP